VKKKVIGINKLYLGPTIKLSRGLANDMDLKAYILSIKQ